MRILTIDTSGQTEAVGIVDSGRLLAATQSPAGRGHSRTLLAAVDEVLAGCGSTLSELDGIAVAIGPGRFSGLRVGLATAKGLATAGECALWGISTLEALAEGAGGGEGVTGAVRDERWIFAAADARRGEVYCALFERTADGTVRRATEDVALPPAEAARRAVERAGGERVLFAGSGAEVYWDEFVGAAGEFAVFAGAGPSQSAPLALARLAERAGFGAAADTGALEPVYIRGAVG